MRCEKRGKAGMAVNNLEVAEKVKEARSEGLGRKRKERVVDEVLVGKGRNGKKKNNGRHTPRGGSIGHCSLWRQFKGLHSCTFLCPALHSFNTLGKRRKMMIRR